MISRRIGYLNQPIENAKQRKIKDANNVESIKGKVKFQCRI